MCSVDLMKREALNIISTLNDAGYEAYFVGGYVRDTLLSRKVKDIDIATSALPSIVTGLFPRTVPTGLQHGTVTVVSQKHTFEVTTFRKEAAYDDFRRPKQVDFIDDLIEDLRRRDFTMNAMALDSQSRLIDPFHGSSDLEKQILRCVGEASQRFNEDALRMMRCIRFAAEYQLKIDPQTWEAIISHRGLLCHIAMERIRMELERIIEGASPHRGIQLLIESRLQDFYKVELDFSLSHWADLSDREGEQILSGLDETRLRWTALFLLTYTSSSSAESALNKLTCAGKKIQAVCSILTFHEWFLQTDQSQESWKIGAVQYGPQILRDWHKLLLTLRKLLSAGHINKLGLGAVPLDHIEARGLSWLEELPVTSLKDLNISGLDLRPLNKAPGPWLGKLLHQLLLDTALQKVANRREELMNRANMLVKELKSDE
jgi:tRNA nucleotidyltransferase (CCA-adding enzyme)